MAEHMNNTHQSRFNFIVEHKEYVHVPYHFALQSLAAKAFYYGG